MAMDENAAAPWRRQYGSVYRFVRRRSRSQEDAEDITQEVFAAAAAALGRARQGEEVPPLAWLYTVARRRLIDRARMGALESGALDPDELADEASERRYGPAIVDALLDGLRSLEDAQRRVIVLKVFEGRSFAEISSLVGASETACRMRLSRGLAALREQLRQRGVTP